MANTIKIRTRLAELGMNASDLAQAVGLDKGYISRVLNGKQNCPDHTAGAIAKALGRTRKTLGL